MSKKLQTIQKITEAGPVMCLGLGANNKIMVACSGMD